MKVKKFINNLNLLLSNFKLVGESCGFNILSLLLLLFLTSVLSQAVCFPKFVVNDEEREILYVVPTVAVFLVVMLICIFFLARKKRLLWLACFSTIIILISAITCTSFVDRTFYLFVLILVWILGPILFASDILLDCFKMIKENISNILKFIVAIIIALFLGSLGELVYAYHRGSTWLFYRMLFFAVLIFIFEVFFLFRTALLEKPERMFLLISLPVGLYMCITLPIAMLISWDDEIHYNRALYMSQNSNAVLTGADVSMAFRSSDRSLSQSAMVANQNYLQELYLNEECVPLNEYLQEQYSVGNCVFKNDDKGFKLERISYLPAAMGMWLGKIICVPFYLTFILGKVFNLLFYISIMYFAIKRLLNGKILLMIIALFPTNLFLASNYSYDFWVIALIALSFSYFCGALQRPNKLLTNKEILIMMGTLFLGCLPKMIYCVLFAIFLFIPKEKFSSPNDVKKFKIFVVFMLLVSFILLYCFTFGSSDMSDIRGGGEVNAKEQIIYILTHPFSFGKMLLRFLLHYLSPDSSGRYISFLGYFNTEGPFPHTIVFSMLCIAALTDCKLKNDLSENIYLHIAAIGISFITMAAVASALYISFTPVGYSTVNGCQFRYITPVLFPFFALSFGHIKNNNMSVNVYRAVFYIFCFITTTSTVWRAIASQIVA